jgi:tetratricopeptide (TPR) repeat protein
VATTLNNLGILYRNTSRFKEAEQAYSEALEIRKTLAAANKDAYLPDVAMTIHNLGLFHFSRKNFPEAFAKLNEAREIRETLAQKNPPAFDLDLCQTLIPLGILHTLSPEGSKETALSLFNRAISILKKYPDVPQAQKYLKIAEELKKN